MSITTIPGTRQLNTRSNRPVQIIVTLGIGLALGLFVAAVSVLPARYAPLAAAAAVGVALTLLVRSARKVFFALVLLDIPFRIATHLNYQTDLAAIGALGGLELSVTTLGLVALYLLWFADLLVKPARATGTTLKLSLPAIVYVALASLSIIVAPDPGLAFAEVFLLVELLLVYIYIVGTVRTREDVIFVLTMLLGGLLLESIVMIGLYAFKRDFNAAGMWFRLDYDPTSSTSFYRVGGTFGSPNNTAGYISFLLVPAIALFLTRANRWLKLLALAAFGAGGIALVLTFTRGGWLAALCGLALFAWFALRRGWLDPKIPLLIAAVFVLLAIPFAGQITTRLLGNDQGSALSRLPLDALAFNIIQDHPLLGVGLNNYALAMKNYVTPDFGGVWLYIVHNHYLLIFAESGIFAFLAFLAFLGVTLRRGWQVWKGHDRLLSLLGVALVAGLLGHMLQMMVEPFVGETIQQFLFTMAALTTALYRIDRESAPAAVTGAISRGRPVHLHGQRVIASRRPARPRPPGDGQDDGDGHGGGGADLPRFQDPDL